MEIVTQTETQTVSSTYLFQLILEYHDQGWEAKKLCQFLLGLEVQVNDWIQHKRLEEVQSLQKIGSSRKITEIGRSTKIGKIGFTGVLQSDFFTNSVKPVLLHI